MHFKHIFFLLGYNESLEKKNFLQNRSHACMVQDKLMYRKYSTFGIIPPHLVQVQKKKRDICNNLQEHTKWTKSVFRYEKDWLFYCRRMILYNLQQIQALMVKLGCDRPPPNVTERQCPGRLATIT